MFEGSRGEEAIYDMNRTASHFGFGINDPPSIRNRLVDRKNAAIKRRSQRVFQPPLEPRTPMPMGKSDGSFSDLT
jgi:hypothetical protein